MALTMGDVIKIYDGQDPRELPNYSMTEAASYLSVASSTLRSWFKGMGETFRPVLTIDDSDGKALSFFNLVEVHVLDSLRQHGARLQEIREALTYLERELSVQRPLVRQVFFTDGVDIFIEHLGGLLNVSKSGQYAMREALADYLKRVEYGDDRVAFRLYPFTRQGALDDPRSVVFDPLVSFGRLVLADTGIPTEEIADRFNAGEKILELASDFGVSSEKVEEAIRCELHLKRKAA